MSAEIEDAVRASVAAGRLHAAVETALRAYGAEILGFLVGVTDDPDAADDVFSAFSERILKSIDRFRWECSLRTWCYTIARNELSRHRARTKRDERHVGLSTAGPLRAPSREPTPRIERSSFRDAFARLRATLEPDDRDLLVLRVDRGMAWLDLARSFLGEEASAEDMTREAARLRKRFQLVKRHLARAASASGLLSG